jgi:heptosyltransferase-2
MTENILIRGVNWIGDAVMSMPAVKALRKAHPESKVSLLVRPSVAPLFEKDPNIDEIILYEDRFKTVTGRLNLAMILKKKSFSKAFLFQNSFDAALITFLAGIPERIGYDRYRRGFLLTSPIPFNGDDRKIHHIDYYLNLLRNIGIEVKRSVPWIYMSIDERLSASKAMSGLTRPIIGINPSATYGSSKMWLPERFAEVAHWFAAETNGSIIIFGNKNESDIANEIEYLIRRQKTENRRQTNLSFQSSDLDLSLINHHSLLNIAGKTSLRELILLISECDIFLTNDSGPMHIAYAAGTPIAAVFGSTSPELTGYQTAGSIVLKAGSKCSPCFERTCANKNNDMRCMYAIESEDVYFSVKKLLPSRKAVFFDRDGTLCRDADYMNKWEDFEIFPEIKNLGRLKEKGFMLIGVSNQSGIARGIVDEDFTKKINGVFIDKYGFDNFYYCPHHPDEHCSCRKPEPGMVFRARAEHGINLKQSYIVGDKDADMLLAKAVGAKGILVKTGKQHESDYADYIVENLKDAVDIILNGFIS